MPLSAHLPKRFSRRHGLRRDKRAGFTLVEVGIGALILILVFVSALGASQIAFRMMDTARMSTLSAQILQSQMENLRLLNWDELGDNTTVDGDASLTTSLAAISNGNPIDLLSPPAGVSLPRIADITKEGTLSERFTQFELTISDSSTTVSMVTVSRPLIKRISLQIAWQDLGGATHQRQFISLYSMDGINDYYYRALAP